jgi:beta-lactamase class A
MLSALSFMLAVAAAPNVDPSAAVSPAPMQCDAPTRLYRKSRALQRGLETSIAHSPLARYAKQHRLAVALVDVSRVGETHYAGINDDEMMYAASLPKVAILLANAQAAHEGKLVWTPEHDQRLGAMITESSNSDASWGFEQVGLDGLEHSVRDPRHCFYDDAYGGLWVGRSYGSGGATRREPLKELSHAATARQAARFLTMMNNSELISREWSQHMLALMGPPKHHHKFVRGLEGRSGVSFLARKSGTWRNWHSDAALIQHDNERYIAVALSELRQGEEVMQEVIRLMDDLIMQGKHRKAARTQS